MAASAYVRNSPTIARIYRRLAPARCGGIRYRSSSRIWPKGRPRLAVLPVARNRAYSVKKLLAVDQRHGSAMVPVALPRLSRGLLVLREGPEGPPGASIPDLKNTLTSQSPAENCQIGL